MGILTPFSVSRGGFLYTMIVLGGEFLLPSSRVLGRMVIDEIDTCITCPSDKLNRISGAVYTSIIPLFFYPPFHCSNVAGILLLRKAH